MIQSSHLIYTPLPSTEAYHFQIFLCSEFILATISSILILACLWQSHRASSFSVDVIFILSLCIGELLYALGNLVYSALSLYQYGWNLGFWGCAIETASLIFCAGLVILSVLGMTANRYLLFVYNTRMSEKQAIWAVAAIMSGLISVILVFVALGVLHSGIGLQSQIYCFTVAWNDDPVAITASAAILFFILQPMILLPIAYLRITLLYIRKKMITKDQTSAVDVRILSNQHSLQVMSKEEWLLIRKAIAISSAYIISWLPFCLKLAFELVVKKEASLEFNFIAACFAGAEPIINAILLIYMDARIRREFLEFLAWMGIPYTLGSRKPPSAENLRMVVLLPNNHHEQHVLHLSPNKGTKTEIRGANELGTVLI